MASFLGQEIIINLERCSKEASMNKADYMCMCVQVCVLNICISIMCFYTSINPYLYIFINLYIERETDIDTWKN